MNDKFLYVLLTDHKECLSAHDLTAEQAEQFNYQLLQYRIPHHWYKLSDLENERVLSFITHMLQGGK